MATHGERPVTPPPSTQIASRKKRERSPKVPLERMTEDPPSMSTTSSPPSRGRIRESVKDSPVKTSSKQSRRISGREDEEKGRKHHSSNSAVPTDSPTRSHSNDGGSNPASRSTTAGTSSSFTTPYMLHVGTTLGSDQNISSSCPPHPGVNSEYSPKNALPGQNQRQGSFGLVEDSVYPREVSSTGKYHQRAEQQQQLRHHVLLQQSSHVGPLPSHTTNAVDFLPHSNASSSMKRNTRSFIQKRPAASPPSSPALVSGSPLFTPISLVGQRQRGPIPSHHDASNETYSKSPDSPRHYPPYNGGQIVSRGPLTDAHDLHPRMGWNDEINNSRNGSNIKRRSHSTKRHRHSSNDGPSHKSSKMPDVASKDTVVNTLVELLLEMDGFQFMGKAASSELPAANMRNRNREQIFGDRSEEFRPTQKRPRRSESRGNERSRRRCSASPRSWSSANSDASVSTCKDPRCHCGGYNVDNPHVDQHAAAASKRRLRRTHDPSPSEYIPDDYPYQQSDSPELRTKHASSHRTRVTSMHSPRHSKGDSRLRREVILLRRRVVKLQNETERLRKREVLTESALDKVLDVLAHITRKEVSPSVFASFADKLVDFNSLPVETKHLVAQLLNGLATLDAALQPRPAEQSASPDSLTGPASRECANGMQSENRPPSPERHYHDSENHSIALGPFDDHRRETVNMHLEAALQGRGDVLEGGSTKQARKDKLQDHRALETGAATSSHHRRSIDGHQSSDVDGSPLAGRRPGRYPSIASSGVNASLSSSCRQLFANLQEGESQIQSELDQRRSSLILSVSELSENPSKCPDSHDEDTLAISCTDRSSNHSTPQSSHSHIRCQSRESLTSQALIAHTDCDSTSIESGSDHRRPSSPLLHPTILSTKLSLSSLTSNDRRGGQPLSPSSSRSLSFSDEIEKSRNPDDPPLINTTLQVPPIATEKVTRRVVPLLGLRGVGSGSWMSGQQTSGETYASYGASGASTISNALDSALTKDDNNDKSLSRHDQLQNSKALTP